MDDGDRSLDRQGGEGLGVGVVPQRRRQLGEQAACRQQRRLAAQLVGRRQARPARVADVLLPLARLGQVGRHLAAGGEQVHLEHQARPVARLVEHVLQRRVRHQPAVPEELAVDLDRREARGQGAARHDVARVDPLLPAVEVDEVAALDVDRADREADRAGVEELEVDQLLERAAQRLGVVVADRRRRAGRLERRRRHPRREEAGDAEQHRDRRVGLVDDVAPAGLVGRRAVDRGAERERGDRLPELAQPRHPVLRAVAGDQGGVDRADRDAGDPVGRVPHRREALVHAGLVGAEGAAALEDEDAILALRRRRPAARDRGGRCGPSRRGAPAGARGLLQWRQLSSMRSRRRSSPGQIRAPGAVPSVALRACSAPRRMIAPGISISSPSPIVPAAWARSCTAQLVSRAYIAWNAAATVGPTVSRPWLRRMRKVFGAEIGDQTRLLLVVQGHAFVVVVAEAGQDEDRELRDRQQAALLRRDRDAVQRVGVHHALHVVARRMHRAVDDEAGRVDRERRLLQHLAFDVDLDQARRRDLVEHQAVGIDQVVLGAGDPGGDVGEDEIVPAEQGDQAVGGGEVEASLPFVGRDPAFEAGDHAREFGGGVHRGLLQRRNSKYGPGEAVLRSTRAVRGDGPRLDG